MPPWPISPSTSPSP
jgi:SAM-dependent methyltransferase